MSAKGKIENITLTRNSVTTIFSGSLIKVNKEVDDENQKYTKQNKLYERECIFYFLGR